MSYDVDSLLSLDNNLAIKLKSYAGLKILMKQDENHRFKEMAKYIGDTGFDHVFTCLPDESIPLVYPKEMVGNISFSRMLTGYVTPTLRSFNNFTKSRTVDIGYRGSIQPLSFGRLAYEKRRIGEDVLNLLQSSTLKVDISSNWEDRKGGMEWFKFLLNCKATLGAESGASIFDLDGNLSQRIFRIETLIGPFNESNEYAEKFLKFISDLENKVNYNQISPRHFEAIATGTLQLLFPGNYSNILSPNKHYFQLNRDYSNFSEALDLISNDKKRNEITKVAYEEVILNKDYWIETFVENFDKKILQLVGKKRKKNDGSFIINSNNKNILLMAAHPLKIDPRIEWIKDYSPSSIKVHTFGIHYDGQEKLISSSKNSQYEISIMRQRWNDSYILKLLDYVGDDKLGLAAVSELIKMNTLLACTEKSFCEILGAPYGHERNTTFRWYLQYFLDQSITLILASTHMKGVDMIISTDLDTLAASLIVKSIYKIPVFYDAHEYYPDSDVLRISYERQFFANLEKKLVPYTDLRQTVSPGLAEIMEEDYNVKFSYVPNCEPLRKLKLSKKISDKDNCNFLYQGNFAPDRGIDLLIDAWTKTNGKAILLLRGPDNNEKNKMIELAKKTGLLNKRIYFPDRVKEEDLVYFASKADVGIISYTPKGLNYSNCSPNKLSQYMAAKLPILCNKTNYVEEITKKSKAGLVIDFNRQEKLVEAINTLSRNNALREKYGNNANRYYQSIFNWQIVSKDMYKAISKYIKVNNSESIYFYENLLKKQLYIYDENESQNGYIPYPSNRQPKVTEHLGKNIQINNSTNYINRIYLSTNYINRIYLFLKKINPNFTSYIKRLIFRE